MQKLENTQPQGMAAFLVIWIGQVISVLASSMTGFAMTLWMYQQTESATAMGLMNVAFILPFLLMSPVAGVMVDRYDRKLMMMVSDIAAFAGTLFIIVALYFGKLEFWHLYLTGALMGLGNTFQWPAYSAAISVMVSKEQLGRVNGLMSLLEAGPAVLAPLLAGALLPLIGLTGILTIDAVTFVFAIVALAIVRIPPPQQTEEGKQATGNMMQEAAFGFKYIFERPSLLGLQLVFFIGNLFTGIGGIVTAPMILARTNQDALIFGTVQTAGAIGAVVGGIVISAWGGFKRRVHGVLAGWIYAGVIGTSLFGLGFGLPIWLVSSVLGMLVSPLINSSNQAIWQAKVAPDLQGRVFSARRLIAWFATPISPIIGGVLADYVLEPAMRTPGAMTLAFGWLVGTGPGAGMGLLMVISGLIASLAGVMGYLTPAIRNAEDILPDHNQGEAENPTE